MREHPTRIRKNKGRINRSLQSIIQLVQIHLIQLDLNAKLQIFIHLPVFSALLKPIFGVKDENILKMTSIFLIYFLCPVKLAILSYGKRKHTNFYTINLD